MLNRHCSILLAFAATGAAGAGSRRADSERFGRFLRSGQGRPLFGAGCPRWSAPRPTSSRSPSSLGLSKPPRGILRSTDLSETFTNQARQSLGFDGILCPGPPLASLSSHWSIASYPASAKRSLRSAETEGVREYLLGPRVDLRNTHGTRSPPRRPGTQGRSCPVRTT